VAGVTTQYIYDGWQVVQEPRNDGVTKFFTYGNYIDEPVCMVTTTATTSGTVYYLQGNNYNVAALTDNAGQVVEHYRIEPYGTFVVLRASGADDVWFTGDDVAAAASGVDNELVFEARTVDTETGEYYFRDRQYASSIGRFLSRDGRLWTPHTHTNGYPFESASIVGSHIPFSEASVSAMTLGSARVEHQDNIFYQPHEQRLWERTPGVSIAFRRPRFSTEKGTLLCGRESMVEPTIYCDGSGTYVVHYGSYENAPCNSKDCIRDHEEVHIADWTIKWPRGCQGVRRGCLPVGNAADYDEFLTHSECNAYERSLECLWGKMGECTTVDCISTIADEYSRHKQKRRGFLCRD
jgi:RHS repeat-associated protein